MFGILAESLSFELSFLRLALLVLVILIESSLDLESNGTLIPGGVIELRKPLEEFIGIDMPSTVSFGTWDLFLGLLHGLRLVSGDSSIIFLVGHY